jgi:hypothetical protein
MMLKQPNKIQVTTNYYIVIINPELHLKTWNAIKLMLEVAEAEYTLYHDHEITLIHMEEISKEDFEVYNYSLN